MADRMWKDSDTGVRNCMDYNKFMGKIQRVSVNVPLQGLAGDFMRMSLNRIRKWVESDPLVQSVFHLHCSVHDEIDFIVKNEYVPFILPRITRLMKLRKMHEKMKWRVPIESDAEYGNSWDVEHHVTGDDDHTPAAWTEIKEIANYIPDEWEVDTLKNLVQAVGSGIDTRIAKAKAFLEESLHPRAFIAANHFFEAKDDKARKKALIAALQLDEYWRIDHTPDDEDDKLETLEAYEKRMGLGVENRDPLTPEFGYLGAIPLTATVKRPTVEVLGEPVEVEDIEVVVSEQTITVTLDKPLEYVTATVKVNLDDDEDEVEEEPTPLKAMAAAASAFAEAVTRVVEQVPAVVEEPEQIVEIIDLDEEVGARLRKRLGVGTHNIRVIYRGKLQLLRNKAVTEVPEEFVKDIHSISEVLNS